MLRKRKKEVVNTVFHLLVHSIAHAVQINYIRVPPAVRNNSGHSAILDCNYSLRPDDTELVVKWYLNDAVVYQWIPPQKPQALGLMKDKLNLTYQATDDPKTAYRAMKIINPTTDLAGEYKCFVSTFADEDFSMKNMIVFVPESTLILLHGGYNQQRINFTCFASEVYPEPKIMIYKDRKDDTLSKNPLQAIEWSTSRLRNGRYSVTVVSSAFLNKLNPGSLIHCELRIPGTGYVKRKSMLYYPPSKALTITSGTGLHKMPQ
ncbi:hypothetical protein ILUMI_12836 [Ignelater luminosus]|uniref:Ig-like domain-containing protein n=1 Tax=Ignelater luminosus TaxID=2038154 RepID=A0A8K0G972_IGNLU|nr:hypothetical protein ILUMI_12836 [Ignelater luminosus]